MDNEKCSGPFRASASIVLASSSPRRRELLGNLGLEFSISAASSEELGPDSGLSPRELVLRNGTAKASEIALERKDAVIIGADTCVALGDEIFGKPRDEEDALRMLEALCNRWHQVFTGCCVIIPGHGKKVSFLAESSVFISGFGLDVLRAYCRTKEPFDKAGAYAVQGTGGFMVRQIKGSWTNVVGLPMTELVEVLLKAGVIKPCVKD